MGKARSLAISEKLGPQLLPLKDGGWWIGTRLMRLDCPSCQGEMFDRPAVLGYRRDMDTLGDQRRGNYRWAAMGWLVWWECGLCGYDAMTLPDDQQWTAGNGLIARWSHKTGPWLPLEEDTGPRGKPAGRAEGRQPIPESLRGLVYARDGYRCRQCDTGEGLSIDHIFPVSRGGSNDASNLQTLCLTCNIRKGAHV